MHDRKENLVESADGPVSVAAVQEQLLLDAPRLRRYIASKISPGLADTVTPDDVLQDVWVSIFRGLTSFRGSGPDWLPRWTTTLANRRLVDAIRAARLRGAGRQWRGRGSSEDTVASFVALLDRLAADRQTPSSVVSNEERVSAIRLALAQLPEQNRRVVLLHYIEHWSLDEIARSMDKTKAAVHSLLYRSRKMLGELLGRESSYFSDVPHT
ncbi:MAG: sigma-70 family RNA polymerase sigma factor [bacterium]|nr:sigma-70 family RNA polymerase sigma factor [bacterium]